MASQHKIIYPLPITENLNVNSENILWDLGRATKRGTKQCPDCGYVNGLRSYACKNSSCNRILKTTDKQKIHIDAIKLVSGVTRQIYSVRVREREKGVPTQDHPDQRGFVQLPCTIYESDKPDRLSEVALCFVNHCERSYSILKCHESDDEDDGNQTSRCKTLNFCVHIESAVKSLSVAHAIEFKHDLINNLKVCDDVKKKLCSLAKSTEGPLVQRIAKNVMAIKCFVNSANPLGYLHFMLEFKKVTNCEEEIDSYYCECNDINGNTSKCLHYYACICAFASDAKLLHKYSSFVQHEFDCFISYDINTLLEEGKDNSYPLENIRIEILRPDLLGLPNLNLKKEHKSNNKKQKSLSTHRTNLSISKSSICKIIKPEEKLKKTLKKMMNSSTSDISTSNIKIEDKIQIISNEVIKKPTCTLNLQGSTTQGTQNSVHLNGTVPKRGNLLEMLGYDEWFTAVIERINYASATNKTSMFFNELEELCQPTIVDVNEVKLEFHIPERFFKKFQFQIYFHTGNYHQEQCEMKSNIASGCSSRFCAIRTMHFAINDVAQLEQLFTVSNIKLAAYQLLVNEQWPFRIAWTGSVYKLSKFGELKLTFIKQTTDVDVNN